MAIRPERLDGPGAVLVAWPGPTAEPVHRRRRRVSARVRRRRALAGLCSAVLFVSVLHGSGGEGSALATRAGAPRAVVLEPGETLWELAERFAPEGADTRAYVDALAEVNDLAGAPPAGTRIKLPR